MLRILTAERRPHTRDDKASRSMRALPRLKGQGTGEQALGKVDLVAHEPEAADAHICTTLRNSVHCLVAI